MTPKKLVDYVIKKSKVDDRKIKNVEVFENFSFMSVPFTEAEIILEAFQKDKNGKKPLVEKAKENDIEVSNHAIDLKTGIEKIREQIQNIE